MAESSRGVRAGSAARAGDAAGMPLAAVARADQRTGGVARAAHRRGRPASDPAFHGHAGAREPVVYAVSHVERYLDCPFKYFSQLRARARRGARRRGRPQPARARTVPSRRLPAVLHRLAGRRSRSVTIRDPAGRRLLSSRRSSTRGSRGCPTPTGRSSAPTCSDRLRHRAWRSARSRSRSSRESASSSGCSSTRSKGAFEFEGPGRPGPDAASRQGGSDRPPGRRDASRRGLQTGTGAEAGPGAAAAGVRRVRHAAARGPARPLVAAVARRLRRVPREERLRVAGRLSAQTARRSTEGSSEWWRRLPAIERGEFPVDPDEPFLCTRCGYAGVCRKDYVGDE